MANTNPIGIFDSGVGGLSVLKRIKEILPDEKLIYIADSAHTPYGNKPQQFIEQRSLTLAGFLFEKNAKGIVVACNTATAAAIAKLRSVYKQRLLVWSQR